MPLIRRSQCINIGLFRRIVALILRAQIQRLGQTGICGLINQLFRVTVIGFRCQPQLHQAPEDEQAANVTGIRRHCDQRRAFVVVLHHVRIIDQRQPQTDQGRGVHALSLSSQAVETAGRGCNARYLGKRFELMAGRDKQVRRLTRGIGVITLVQPVDGPAATRQGHIDHALPVDRNLQPRSFCHVTKGGFLQALSDRKTQQLACGDNRVDLIGPTPIY